MKIVQLLVLLSVSECSRSRLVNGYVGQNVTLSCSYKSQSKLPACWNRGELTLLGCRNQLISSSGDEVIETTRASSRYQLLGRLDKRDVSLTILNLTEADAGQYSCRVEIPGMFNDKKHLFTLVVKKAEQMTTSATSASQTVTATAAFSTAAVRLTSTKSPGSSSLGPVRVEENGTVAVVLVCVLFGLIVLITAGGLFIITIKWGKLRKIHQAPQVNTLAEFHSGSSALHSRATMVENIYEIDGEGEYQYLPRPTGDRLVVDETRGAFSRFTGS